MSRVNEKYDDPQVLPGNPFPISLLDESNAVGDLASVGLTSKEEEDSEITGGIGPGVVPPTSGQGI